MTQPPYGDEPLPTSGQPYPTSGQPYPYSGSVPFTGTGSYPASGPPFPSSGPPADPAPPAPLAPPTRPRVRNRRRLAAAVLVLLLCAGGGVSAWLLMRNVEGDGAAEPGAAVDAFLTAIYTEKDTDKAGELVCSEARDERALADKVAEVEAYDAKYESPRFEWDDPKVDEQDDERAVVSVQLRVTTADERTAEQRLRFTVVQKTGWWVCEVA